MRSGGSLVSYRFVIKNGCSAEGHALMQLATTLANPCDDSGMQGSAAQAPSLLI